MSAELCWLCKKIFVEDPDDEEFVCESCRQPATLNVCRVRFASEQELLTDRCCYHCLRASFQRDHACPYCTLLATSVDFSEVCDALELAQGVTIKD